MTCWASASQRARLAFSAFTWYLWGNRSKSELNIQSCPYNKNRLYTLTFSFYNLNEDKKWLFCKEISSLFFVAHTFKKQLPELVCLARGKSYENARFANKRAAVKFAPHSPRGLANNLCTVKLSSQKSKECTWLTLCLAVEAEADWFWWQECPCWKGSLHSLQKFSWNEYECHIK